MRILMVITLAEMGGAQRQVLDAARFLIKDGNEVTIAAGTEFNDLFHSATTGDPLVPVLPLPHLRRAINPFFDFLAGWEIYRAVKKVQPDIVHAHSSKAGVLASFAAKLAGAKIVYTAHGFVFREELSWGKRCLYRWAERSASWFRDHVITVSASDATEAVRLHIVPREKLTVIHNGINPAVEKKILPALEARTLLSEWTGENLHAARIVLSIANLYPSKNIPLLVRAFALVVPRVPAARLVVVGDGRDRAMCLRIIKDTPELHGKVFLVGKKPTACKVLRGADMLAVSSSKEGFPYVILEAKLAGTPIVATRVGGIPEMQRDQDISLVVPHDPEELASAIVRLLEDGPRVRPRLAEEFTVEGMVERLEHVYREVLD